jgi:hypothetical protein
MRAGWQMKPPGTLITNVFCCCFLPILPESPAGLHGFLLPIKKEFRVSGIRADIHEIGGTLLNDLGIYELTITKIYVGQRSTVSVLFFTIEFEANVLVQYEIFVDGFGLISKWFGFSIFMLDFRCVDPDVSNMASVLQDNRISVGNPPHPIPGFCNCILGDEYKAAADKNVDECLFCRK